MADERAVSSVLGEMLMLSITVVLASVVIVSM
ncbi:MAG: type IV pilin, partial [Methermicoccaceae archaeon]